MQTDPSANIPLLERIDHALEHEKRWIYLLFALAFTLKLVFIIQSRNSLQTLAPLLDSRIYDDLARAIAKGNLFPGEAFFMGPLYPYVMGFIYSISGNSVMILRLVQVTVGALTVVLTYRVGVLVVRPVTAMLGALLLTLYGAITFYEGQMLMMWLGTFLNMSLLYVLLCVPGESGLLSFFNKRPLLRYVLAGLLLGLSALARASILIMVPVILVWIIRRKRANPLRSVAIFLISVFIIIFPVTIHNYIASKDFVFITYNGGLNFYIGNNPDATGVYSLPAEVEPDDISTKQYLKNKLGRDIGPSDISDYWMDRSFSFIREHPGKELSLLARKAVLYINGYEWPQIENYEHAKDNYGIFKILLINFHLLISLGILGIFYSFWFKKDLFLHQWFTIAYSISIILFFVSARYRIQIAPLLCFFAAYAIAETASRLRNRNAWGFLSLLLLILLLFATRPGLFNIDTQKLRAEEHIHRAQRWEAIGNMEKALREINFAIDLDRRSPQPYVHRASFYSDSGNYRQAVDDYRQAIEIDDSMPSIHYSLALTLEEARAYTLAIDEYSKAIEKDPLMIEAHNNLGILFRRMQKYDDAIKQFKVVIRLNPGYIKAYNNMGAAYAEWGDTDSAIRIFREAITLDPEYPHSYKNLAMAYIEKNMLIEAKSSLERYLELVPDDAYASKVLQQLSAALDTDR